MKNIYVLLGLLLGSSSFAVAPAFQLRSKAAIDVLWTDGVMQIARPLETARPKLGYAVFKAKPSTALQRLLPVGFQLAPLPQSLDMNYYVVPIDRIELLEALAQIAHESTGMCGSLELVTSPMRLAHTISIHPPIYGGAIVFDEAKTLIEQVNISQMDQTIDTLTSLPSRYFRHPTGETAHITVRQLWEARASTGRWTFSERSQPLSAQKSIVARLEGKKFPDETLILGAHLDSIVSRSGNSNTDNAPGADDDASGIAAITEVLRLIENNNLSFDRSIELQAYAAEEVGLIGSKEIASAYAAATRKIAGMFQIDMAYYSKAGSDSKIHLLEDYTSRDLRRQTIDWIRNYLGPVYKLGRIPRGSASDHKAFWENGYPTVFPFEDPDNYNPSIHTSNDTSAQFDDGLLLRRITQTALLFTIHQGGLQSLASTYASMKDRILPEETRGLLKIAVQSIGSQYYFAIATPLEATTLEFCSIEDSGVPHCIKERETLDKVASTSNKKIFYSSTSWSFAAGQKWRVLAYNSSDELIAWRQFTFSGS